MAESTDVEAIEMVVKKTLAISTRKMAAAPANNKLPNEFKKITKCSASIGKACSSIISRFSDWGIWASANDFFTVEGASAEILFCKISGSSTRIHFEETEWEWGIDPRDFFKLHKIFRFGGWVQMARTLGEGGVSCWSGADCREGRNRRCGITCKPCFFLS